MKSSRINLTIPLDLAIEIEKLCEDRGIKRTKFMAEAVREKLEKHRNISLDELVERNVEELEKLNGKVDELLRNRPK